jgi:hypothetical protein
MKKQLLTKNKRIAILSLLLSLFALETFAQVNDKFFDKEEIYSFELPRGNFSKTSENYFTSKKLSASIRFRSETDYIGDDNFNASLEEQFKIAKKGIKVNYQMMKNGKFTISGTDLSGNIVYIRGDCESLSVRNNPDNINEISWLWTKTMIVTFTYPPANKKLMDKNIETFIKTYKLNVYMM